MLVFPQAVLAPNTLQGLSKGILEKSWLSSGTDRSADAKEGSGRDQRGAEHLPSRLEAALAQNVSFSPGQTHLRLWFSLKPNHSWLPACCAVSTAPEEPGEAKGRGAGG